MIHRICLLMLPLALATFISNPGTAHAELNACGGIFLSGDAGCAYRPKKECMTQCMTVAVEESCVSEVYNECETSCTASASTECVSTCSASCVDNCMTTTTTEEGPSCMDLCLADCDDDSGSCNTREHKGPCGRCQKHNCAKRCEEKCGDAEAPKKVVTKTECMPTCSDVCTASCTAKANINCQVDCQENTYTNCEQKMVERCDTQCNDKGGAIFCDGQFVNASNVNSCADELKAKLEIKIDIDAAIQKVGNAASDTADCVDKACSVADVGSRDTRALWLLSGIVGLGLWRGQRRRSQRK